MKKWIIFISILFLMINLCSCNLQNESNNPSSLSENNNVNSSYNCSQPEYINANNQHRNGYNSTTYWHDINYYYFWYGYVLNGTETAVNSNDRTFFQYKKNNWIYGVDANSVDDDQNRIFYRKNLSTSQKEILYNSGVILSVVYSEKLIYLNIKNDNKINVLRMDYLGENLSNILDSTKRVVNATDKNLYLTDNTSDENIFLIFKSDLNGENLESILELSKKLGDSNIGYNNFIIFNNELFYCKIYNYSEQENIIDKMEFCQLSGNNSTTLYESKYWMEPTYTSTGIFLMSNNVYQDNAINFYDVTKKEIKDIPYSSENGTLESIVVTDEKVCIFSYGSVLSCNYDGTDSKILIKYKTDS